MKPFFIKWLKRVAATTVVAAALFLLLDLVFPVRADFEYSPVIEDRDGKVLYSFLTADQQWRMKTRLDEITPELKKAIVFKEDKYFYHHPGVNVGAICRAAFNNMFKLRRTSGASTITMQVARLLQPKKRSYINKVVEMFRASQLELHYSKDEILQLYLNLVPYGSNIQGVKAASILYFDKSPDQLSLAEITALSIIPNRPNSLTIGKDNRYIVEQRNKWLREFKHASLFSDADISDAINEPLTAYRHPAPKYAPQLALRTRRAYSSLPEVRTTVSRGMQGITEEIVANYVDGLKLHGIYNASVLVVDNQTHEVMSYLGSNDFSDKLHNGQVDGVMARRSPGSALKPLLYGLCFDRGLITPKSVIADVPINFKGYSPENYDLDFRGNVTIEEALQKSLNIPAVKMLDELSVRNFVTALSGSGFTSVWHDRKKLGLSMILGGCEVRLEEMTALYSSFANDGQYIPLRYVISDSVWLGKKTFHAPQSNTLLSADANFILTNILTQLHRPDLPNGFDQAADIPRIAWKTGTSYGRKDAWSIGYNKRYTIGVWVGNFNGRGVTELNGAGIATPLLFRLFNAIDKNVGVECARQSPGTSFRFVCRETGKVPNDYCTDQVMDYYIPGRSSNERCDHLREVWLSADESFSYCTSCLPPSGYKQKTFTNVSAELSAFYDSRHIPYVKIPPHNPECSRMFDGGAPIINSLTNEMTYIITDRGKQQLQLSCTAANDVQQVYWYVNDKFLGNGKVNQKLLFIPADPEIKISCTDDKGRNADIRIKVKFI